MRFWKNLVGTRLEKFGAITKATWSKSETFSYLPPPFNQNIALIGFMAVGKSAVGRKLARRLKRRFVDLDKAIERSEGMRVRDIFENKGEAYFRDLERQALAHVLQENAQVISTGGGVVLNQDNLRLLKERSLIVCLRADIDTIARRAGGRKLRPLLMGTDKVQRIKELLQQRQGYYAKAHIDIDTSNLTVDEVVDKIIALAAPVN
jgi:shikimate kinase